MNHYEFLYKTQLFRLLLAISCLITVIILCLYAVPKEDEQPLGATPFFQCECGQVYKIQKLDKN